MHSVNVMWVLRWCFVCILFEFCLYYVNIMWAFWLVWEVSLDMLLVFCGYFVVILCWFSVNVLLVFCRYYARSLCRFCDYQLYSVNIMLILCWYCVSIVLVLCLYSVGVL